jgi:hypothetical protein
MKLIEFPEQTTIIAKDQPPYLPLPAYQVPLSPEGQIICCWKLSLLERLKVLFKGKIWHSVLTFQNPLQPQLLSANKPFSIIC